VEMAELIPFLGHVGMEKLTCNIVSMDPDDDREYIRIIANSAPRSIPECQDGPGASCGFDEYVYSRFLPLFECVASFGTFKGLPPSECSTSCGTLEY
jgi:hypothetical protein